LQHNFLDLGYTRSQDFSMPQPKTLTKDDVLFTVTVQKERTKKLIQDLMTEQEKQDTGLASLNAQQLANLNRWLDPDKVLAPGGQPH
jgi:predicted lactoylglutathione lyase